MTEIKEGCGAAIHGYSDIHSATVIKVWPGGKKVTLQRDSAKLLNGVDSGEPDALKFSPGGFVGHVSGEQRWELTPDPLGWKSDYTLRSNGRWILVGDNQNRGSRAIIGERKHHRDFNF